VNPVACPRLDCSGTLDEEGFCDHCGEWAPLTPLTSDQAGPASEGTPFSSGALSVAGSGMTAGDPIQLPPLPEDDPDSLVLTKDRQVVPERQRDCGNCGHPVGRSRADQPGQPGLTQGFCPKCRTRFSFEPTLKAGNTLGRYEIVGPLAHGGVGWVYLAKDTSLDDRRVVLKGLIDTGNEQALEASVAERRYLTMLDHPNIVRILDFVTQVDPQTQTPAGYIVMEFAGGWTLERVKREAVEDRHPLPVESVISYGLHLLRALGYLHERGYLFCDLKPDNVIHGNQVRLIDLGAVRAITDRKSPTWGARAFRVSDDEIHARGLTVRSDLYSVGTTLRALYRNSPDDRAARSTAQRLPFAEGLASFDAVLRRATAQNWDSRFESAADMAEQLTGVLRQVRALRGDPVRAEVSRVFGVAGELFDAGLGTPPELTRWTTSWFAEDELNKGVPMDDGRPDPRWVAVRLPDPLIDPADAAAPTLVTVSATDPVRLLTELERLPHTIETALWRCRIQLARHLQGAPDGLALAQQGLFEAGTIANGGDSWRITWHSGLLALIQADPAAARRHFEQVQRDLAGETAPMLAVAFCAEVLGDRTRAEQLYHAVLLTDRSQVSAAFGLARIRLAGADRDGAVAVMDEVPSLSKYFDAARTAAIQVRIGTFAGTGDPRWTDLEDGAHRLTQLGLGPDDTARHRLTTLVQQAALVHENRGPAPAGGPGAGAVLGDPMTGPDLRRRLEASFRRLARQAPDRNQHSVLTDLANAVRPSSLI
jgi:serine/threonine-protein kinase PknG